MKKYLIYILIILVIVVISMGLYFFLNKESADAVQTIQQVIYFDPLIQAAGRQIDLRQSHGSLTQAEWVAAIGHTVRGWSAFQSGNSDIWYLPYTERAVYEGWLIYEEDKTRYQRTLSKGQALQIFMSMIEKSGQDRYPNEWPFYIEEVAAVNQTVRNRDRELLTKAFSKGFLMEDLSTVSMDQPFTKGEAYRLLSMVVNPQERTMPFLILNNAANNLAVDNYHYPAGKYLAGDTLSFSFDMHSLNTASGDYWLGMSLRDSAGRWIDLSPQKITMRSGSTQNVEKNWVIPLDVMSGHYHIVLALWDQNPESALAVRVAHSELPDMVLIYKNQDNFNEINKEVWQASTFTLGRTDFKPEHVSIVNNTLQFFMPANTFEGGELQSLELKGYGSYEIKMKLPDAPGSITGFFMYKAPDYFFEIDIEIYNQTNGDYFLTTYADGSIQKEFLGTFPFDPTADFNRYRFDYYPDRLDYYVNDRFIVRFTEGYPREPMHLIVNCWYPNWVPGGPATKDKVFLAEWIRY